MKQQGISRRDFVKRTSMTALSMLTAASAIGRHSKSIPKISAHLWVYASAFPPDWNSNPVLDRVFSDLKYAGLAGVELMEVNLRDEKFLGKIKQLITDYELPVTGTSYGAIMWNKAVHASILTDIEKVVANLQSVGGTTFGISVGTPGRIKTDRELDDQAELLLKVRKICDSHRVVANLHNHTYEVENNLHDLKGTLSRIPDFKLGPDIGWLAKAMVDPVDFIRTYGKQMVYMHLRDIDSKGEWTEAIGEGTIDFEGVARALNQSGFAGTMAIELAFPNGFKPTKELKEIWRISNEVIKNKFSKQ
jgi:sugar phosphate isomerase/epimerase